jgi:hypothetical protein
MDKSSINVFEVKMAIKELSFKISAGDVFNEFLYLGDEKGTIIIIKKERCMHTRFEQGTPK